MTKPTTGNQSSVDGPGGRPPPKGVRKEKAERIWLNRSPEVRGRGGAPCLL